MILPQFFCFACGANSHALIRSPPVNRIPFLLFLWQMFRDLSLTLPPRFPSSHFVIPNLYHICLTLDHPPFSTSHFVIPTLYHVCLTFTTIVADGAVSAPFLRERATRGRQSVPLRTVQDQGALLQSRRVLINKQQNRGNAIIVTKPFISHQIIGTTF